MEHVQIPGANKLHVLQFIQKKKNRVVYDFILMLYRYQTILEFNPILV